MSNKLLLLFKSNILSLEVELQAELYDTYYRLVYDMVFYLVADHASTEDIIQESFMRALKKPPKYMDGQKINAWLKTLTRNVALNYLRKNKKMRDALRDPSVYIEQGISFAQYPMSVVELVENKLSMEALVEEIHKLKFEYRHVLILQYVHELTYKEIAEVVGTTEGAVRQRLARAKQVIKENMQRKWGDHNEAK